MEEMKFQLNVKDTTSYNDINFTFESIGDMATFMKNCLKANPNLAFGVDVVREEENGTEEQI